LFKLGSKYSLITEEGKPILYAKRVAKCLRSYYRVAFTPETLDEQSLSARLQANFLGSAFCLYDNGADSQLTSMKPVREELAAVTYVSFTQGVNLNEPLCPRQINVHLPSTNSSGQRIEWRPTSKEESMLSCYSRGQCMGLFTLHSKKPEWSIKKNCYVLNYGGRVRKTSVKNFQLVGEGDSTIYLQFGRFSQNEFILDFRWPFSPLQAFAVGLSSLDNKLACD
jgi:tubby-related protein 1